MHKLTATFAADRKQVEFWGLELRRNDEALDLYIEGNDGEIVVEGFAHSVMRLIGLAADHGEDTLISVR